QTAIALGLISAGTTRDKTGKTHTAIREGAKTFRYAFLFGAGALRAGWIIADIVRTVMVIAPNSPLGAQFWGGNKHPSESALRQPRHPACAPCAQSSRPSIAAAAGSKGSTGAASRPTPTTRPSTASSLLARPSSASAG